MRLPRPRLRLALALVALGAVVTVELPAHARIGPEGTAEEAKAAIASAREATREGDVQAALEHYQRALSLQPAAKLHFNIAVCHHRLLAEHPAGSKRYEHHRGEAVDAYNRYLQAAPEAEDADDVAQVVRALGGTPLSADAPEPWSIELVEPDEVPDAPGFADDWNDEGEPDPGPTPDPAPPGTTQPPPSTKAPRGPLGRFGVFVPVSLASPAQLARSTELRPAPMLGLGLRGNAFIGPGRAVALGGELSLMAQPVPHAERHRMSTGTLGVLVESRHPLGTKGRVEIGGGGVVAVATQALVYSGDDRLRCSPDREASRRNGLWAQARITVAALLGARRNHELSLRFGPGLAAMSGGSKPEMDADGMSCADEPTAFETFGLRDGPALVVSFDLGYAPRF